MSAATVTSKGQITIPKEVRDALGLEPGVKIDFVRVNTLEYRLRPKNVRIKEMAGILRHDGPPITLAEMDEAIAAGAAGEPL